MSLYMFSSDDFKPLFLINVTGNNGLKSSELKLVESVIEENQEVIAEHWNKFFNKSK